GKPSQNQNLNQGPTTREAVSPPAEVNTGAAGARPAQTFPSPTPKQEEVTRTMTVEESKKPTKLFFVLLAIVLLVISISVAGYFFFSSKKAQPLKKEATITQVITPPSEKADVVNRLDNLRNNAAIRINEIDQRYPDISFKTVTSTQPLPQNPQLIKDYRQYLKTLNLDSLEQSFTYQWAKPFYTLGLLAYRNEELDLVAPFWQTASNLAPEWSYFHMELANFYLSQGEASKAQSQIDFCLQFQNPQEHCTQYLEENLQQGKTESVGFLASDVEKDI
ncbi:MAG: hypothetical protein ACC618_03930, partial [Patescibacteria group bacterium]